MQRSTKTSRFALLGLLAATCILAGAGCGNKGGGAGGSGGGSAKATGIPPISVFVKPVSTGTISEVVPVVGNLQTLYDVNLSPPTAGRLVSVTVREGDTVRKGQVVAQIDPTTAQATVRQDQANVLSAQAKVDQAQAQYGQGVANIQVAIANAQSALRSANINLQKVKTGGTPQEKQESKQQLAQQQANYQNALNAYNRENYLYRNGAVALSDLQNAETTYNVQKAILGQYQQIVSQALQGGRPEDIATAQQTVLQDQQNLANTIANRATNDVNRQAVVAAKAALAQSRATLTSANQELANTYLVSPIDGVVALRNADAGQVAQPGTAVVEVVDLRTVYYQPTVSEDQLRQIAPGQRVAINVDAFPGQTFYGKVTNIYPSASTTNRQFSIRVTIPNTTEQLRPGMYARGSITTLTRHNVVVVPVAAMLPQAQSSGYAANTSSTGIATGGATLPPQMAFVVSSDNKAQARNLTLGITDGENAQVTSGLQVGDQLIVTGQGELQPGSPVKISGQSGGAGGHHHRGGGPAAGAAPNA